jgi:hypothetical protein
MDVGNIIMYDSEKSRVSLIWYGISIFTLHLILQLKNLKFIDQW